MKFFYNFCLKDDAALDGDILSGVRKGYFDDFQKIRDKITVNSDADSLVYDYAIEKGKPMSWSVRAQDKTILQDVKTAEDGRYYIHFYRGGSLYKRVLFSKLHTLLRVEYFDIPTGLKVVSLEPRKAKNGLCILYESAADDASTPLYAMSPIDDDRLRERVMRDFDDYTVVASTDDGLLLFLSSEQEQALRLLIERVKYELDEEREISYVGGDTPLFDRIKANDFNVKRNLATSLDITKATEFSYTPPEPEETTLEPAPGDEEDAVAQAAADAIRLALSDEGVPEGQTESAADGDDLRAPHPDKRIMADGAQYSYYGELDANGNRSGYGRTVTEEGRTAYEGHYFNDKRSGNGAYYYKDGSLCYSGEWVENVRHGVGVGVSSHDGAIHVGRWSYNKPEGNGVRLTAEGDIRFVCKELSDGTTVLMNYLPDDTVLVAKYDEKGKKLSEKTLSLNDLFK